MTLEELLSSLGYAGSPCFLRRGDGRFETEMGYGHIFRRAIEPQDPKTVKRTKPPRWQAEGVYGIRESAEPTSRFTPIVYVCTAKDEQAAADLHRLLWNQDVAPYIIVHTTTGLRVYSGFTYSPKARKAEETGVLQALTDFKTAKSIVKEFERREIDEGRLWQHPHLRIDPSKRVYHRLLSSLRELDKTLQKDGAGLSKEVSHALIGKYVYLRYLRDRGILSDERLAIWNLKAADIFGSNAKKTGLQKLSDNLDEWLNGEIFPLPWTGKHSPSVDEIRDVSGAFRGDEHSEGSVQTLLDLDAYNFAFIPIETLSLVYEQFLHIGESNATGAEKPKKSKGRQEGAYYTPLPLVNFMLAGLERQRPLERGMKVLDPSSGSGSFLVQTYRLLIEKTFPVTKIKPKPKDLRDVLEESIFGCDVDGDACQVTQLSLLLTLLDYVDPPDLTGSMHSFKLPTLCETKNEKKLASGHTPNLLKHNFFGIEPKLAASVLRKQGAKADWDTQGFDWIVGNPPWKPISPKQLGENDGPVWDWMKSHEKSKPVGLNQAAQAFAWEAPRYLKADGECALLIPANGLFEEPSIGFRSKFFTKQQVHSVSNFSNFARILFDGRAEVPAASIGYRKRSIGVAIEPDESISVFTPFIVNQEATRPQIEGKRGKIWSLSVNASEVSMLEQSEVASGSGLPWKLAMWGSAWDERLLRRLEKKWDSIFTLEGTNLIVCQGPELRLDPKKADEEEEDADDGSDEDKPTFEYIPDLVDKSSLVITKLNRLRNIFVFPTTSLTENKKAYLRLRGGKAGLVVCQAPHVIVSAARNFAIYSDEFIIVPARQIGIVSCSNDKDFLKALSLFLSSDFAFYHQFFRSTELGVKRDRATLESLRKMPIPLTSLSRSELKEWSALHAKLAKCKPRRLEDTKKKPSTAQRDLFEEPDDGLEALLEQLNNMTADVLGLTKEERCLVHDLVQVRYALNDGKRGDAAMRAPDAKELKTYAKALKDELDDFAGDFAGRCHKITVVESADAASAMIEIDFTTDQDAAKKPSILSASHAEAKALCQTRTRLLKDEGAWQWAYFDRNLRIYRGRKTYLFKPLNRFHWTMSAALTDASQIIAETLSGS
jgi:uncharacterized protein (DUF1330 family)